MLADYIGSMAKLRISMFGGLALESDAGNLPQIPSRAGRSLFAYLVTHRDTAPTRDLLAGLFWPEMAETQARRRLSHALWQIQTQYGTFSMLTILNIEHSHY